VRPAGAPAVSEVVSTSRDPACAEVSEVIPGCYFRYSPVSEPLAPTQRVSYFAVGVPAGLPKTPRPPARGKPYRRRGLDLSTRVLLLVVFLGMPVVDPRP
jgi:hypothetical protein